MGSPPRAGETAADWQHLEEFIDVMWQSTVEASAAMEEQRRREGWHELTCHACGATTHHGGGWRADLAIGAAGRGLDEVAVYCPGCWARRDGSARAACAE